ncbi:MAG: hypothetical protein JO040_01620, partial [Gemmatimonadetes bacterium]|nr:hypothetical protein [Gemmatimonadota bacterium]
AAKRGVVLAAGKPGKYKAVCQNFSIGTAILWYALQSKARADGWHGDFWHGWQQFHFGVSVVTLGAAVILTVYSLFVYLDSFRSLDLGARR